MWTRNYGALGQTAWVCFGVGEVCPDVDKELWRLGPDGSGEKKKKRRPERRGRGEKGQESPGERTDGRRRRDGKRLKESRGERESEARLEWRRGLSPEIGEKKDDERRWR
ncbi:hypothetical protein TNCV_1747781 [Trichonephila clavipes]|nr:hypothetical protein TNCV_1747781 [Trichonephila clavipes]